MQKVRHLIIKDVHTIKVVCTDFSFVVHLKNRECTDIILYNNKKFDCLVMKTITKEVCSVLKHFNAVIYTSQNDKDYIRYVRKLIKEKYLFIGRFKSDYFSNVNVFHFFKKYLDKTFKS